MLIVGPRCTLDAFLSAAAAEMLEPARLLKPAEDVPIDLCGTLVLHDASALDERQQRGLLALLSDAAARPQIISLSETHLWRPDGSSPLPLDLYYHLNTICLELEAEPERRRERGTVVPPRAARSDRTETHRAL